VLEYIFLSNELPARALRAVGLLIGFWLAAWVLTTLVRAIATRRGITVEPRSVLGLSLGPLRGLIVVLGLYYATRELALAGRADALVSGGLYLSALGVAVLAVMRTLSLSADAYLLSLEQSERQRALRDYVPTARKLVSFVVVGVGCIIAFHHFGIEVSALITTLGVGGLAVGFAAKETLSNMIAGFTILVDRPFRLGDRVRLATGEVGEIVDVGVRSTRILLLEKNLLVVPNAELTNSRIVNYNQPSPLQAGSVSVCVAYDSNVAEAERIISAAVKAQAQVAESPAPSVVLKQIGDRGLELALTFYALLYTDVAAAEDRIRRAILTQFGAARIRLAPTQIEVNLNRAS
jgi:small-conductance mechanosensitive channel